MNNASPILKLADKLSNSDLSRLKCLIGFDGFVDEVVHVVKKRVDANNYVREETLKDYGERIAKTSGLSSNVEIVTVSQKIGGNGPIMANALSELGADVSYIGALGYPEMNPVFIDLKDNFTEIHSISNPASTDAVEFYDGKIIRSKISALNDVNYKNIIERIGEKNLTSLIDANDFLGFVNWSLLSHASSVYKGILENIVPELSNKGKKKNIFFDLADPYARTAQDIKEVLLLISQYSSSFSTVLGLNLREALQVCNLYGHNRSISDYDLKDLCTIILDSVGVSQVVIHPTDSSCCMTENRVYYHACGPFCKSPALTTGAGDNFNAGFMLGNVLGFPSEECLLLGMAASGYYVRNAKSATRDELISFLSRWAKDKV